LFFFFFFFFDSDLDDILSISGQIQRLYRPRSEKDQCLVMSLVTKRELRRWLENEGSRDS